MFAATRWYRRYFSPRKRFLIVSSAILSCDAEMRRSVSFRRMPYEPQTSVVPFVLPPVGHFGRPLRDLDDSPALGMSQLNVDGVDENVRRCVVAWAQRVCRAECMQHARVVKESREEGALLLPTRIVVAIVAVCGSSCSMSSVKHQASKLKWICTNAWSAHKIRHHSRNEQARHHFQRVESISQEGALNIGCLVTYTHQRYRISM